MFEEVNGLLEKVNMDFSIQEEPFLRQSTAARGIPYPKTLIKDHKKINEKGESSTRLVIPATNFTATFYKIGYLRIKQFWTRRM